ncbi:MAG: hypothetical protein RSG57_01270, partial [Christensenellaceae bacterium]
IVKKIRISSDYKFWMSDIYRRSISNACIFENQGGDSMTSKNGSVAQSIPKSRRKFLQNIQEGGAICLL